MFVATGVGCTCSPRKSGVGCTCSPRKSRHRLPHDAAAPGRPVTLAALLPATWSEVPPADSTLEPCKMDALCFDIDAKPYCRNPFRLISIQNPRGGIPPPSYLAYFQRIAKRPSATVVRPRSTRLPECAILNWRAEAGCGLYLQPAQRTRNGCRLYLQPAKNWKEPEQNEHLQKMRR